jgi:hypothetical protein
MTLEGVWLRDFGKRHTGGVVQPEGEKLEGRNQES